MILRPPRTTLTVPLFPYPTLFRSPAGEPAADGQQPDQGKPGQPRPGEECRSRPRHIPQRPGQHAGDRSEEHTSELQSLMRISYAVFCLKKKQLPNTTTVDLHLLLFIYESRTYTTK